MFGSRSYRGSVLCRQPPLCSLVFPLPFLTCRILVSRRLGNASLTYLFGVFAATAWPKSSSHAAPASFCSSHVVQSRDNASASHSRNCRRRSSKIILTKMSNSTPAGPPSCPGATTASCCRVTGSQLWRIAMRRDDTVSFVARSVFPFQFGCLNTSLLKCLGRIVFRHWGSWRGGALTI